jgi:hypothetical protein
VPSLIPRPAPSHSSGAAVRAESHDSERTISEAAVREMVAFDEHAAVELPTLGMMVTVAVGPSKEVVGVSIAQVAALVHRPRIRLSLFLLPLVPAFNI